MLVCCFECCLNFFVLSTTTTALAISYVILLLIIAPASTTTAFAAPIDNYVLNLFVMCWFVEVQEYTPLDSAFLCTN